MSKPDIQVQIWRAPEIAKNLDAIAGLRIRVFRDFPYLYEGSLDYERKYLQVYLNSPRSVMVAALDSGRPVGLSSAIPLADETADVQAPFLRNDFKLSDVFYFGESILLSEYRGLGLGNVFFDEREKAARGFRQTCFCAVERPADHPLKPAGYRPLHEFWQKRGYAIRTELQTQFSWTDVGEKQETPKTMTFWMKEWL